MNGDPNEAPYPELVETGLKTQWLGRPLHYFPTVTSTNDLLADLAKRGATAGTLILSDYQQQGKGRLGRRWLAPAGTSLLFSLLLRPDWPAEQAGWITMLGGLSAAEAIKSATGLAIGLKWPNDLVLAVQNEWRKVGGLLLEGQFAGDRLSSAILGIGINVNIKAEQLPVTDPVATSLLIESGQITGRAELLILLLQFLEQAYEAADGGLSPHAEWERRLVTLGHQVQVTWGAPDQRTTGIAEGTDEWGRLLVRDGQGHQHTFSAGDVTLQVDNSGD